MTRIHPYISKQGAGSRRIPTTAPSPERRLLTPMELAEWLQEHSEEIADRWLLEVRSRAEEMDEEVLALVGDFLHLLTAFLAPGMGAYRDQVERLFQQASELFGNLGAHRGQAAGEAVEEFQLLREVVLRFLHTHPPADGTATVGLRDLLQLNRLVDLGVTYASVGHTDTLFFDLFHGAGVSGQPTPELLAEAREQVAGLRSELDRLLVHETANGAGRET